MAQKVPQRWMTPDPLGEKYESYSPYNYCIGNPINLIDRDGNEPGPPATLVQQIPKAIPGAPKLPGLLGGLIWLVDDMNARLAPSEVMKRPDGDVIKELYEDASNEGSLKNGGQVARTSKSESQKQEKTTTDGGGKKTNPKKEAREAGRQKREEQPGSEKRAKDYAKQLEKAEGKDARRAAHDSKDKMGKDRTVKELKEDYKQK